MDVGVEGDLGDDCARVELRILLEGVVVGGVFPVVLRRVRSRGGVTGATVLVSGGLEVEVSMSARRENLFRFGLSINLWDVFPKFQIDDVVFLYLDVSRCNVEGDEVDVKLSKCFVEEGEKQFFGVIQPLESSIALEEKR